MDDLASDDLTILGGTGDSDLLDDHGSEATLNPTQGLVIDTVGVL